MVGKKYNLPTSCPRGNKFDIQHSLSCKNGGFIYIIRHNDLRDLTANMTPEMCNDTEIEPKLTPLSGEELQGRISNNSNEARVYIRTGGFWERGQHAFFDLRVFDPNAGRCRKSSCSSAMSRMKRKRNELTMNESFK